MKTTSSRYLRHYKVSYWW